MVYVYGNKIILEAVELIVTDAFSSIYHRPVIKNLEILAAGTDGPVINATIYINPQLHAVEIVENRVLIGLFDRCHNKNHFRWAQLMPEQQNWHEYADN